MNRARGVSSILSLIALTVIGCSGSPARIDRSADALNSRDLTLVSSCVSTPSSGLSLASGVDSCRFTVGDRVDGSWTLVVPPPDKARFVTGGTIDVYYKDLHKSYAIKSWATQIPFSEIFGPGVWTSGEDETVLEALATVNWTDDQGLNQVSMYRGIAVLVITSPGYSRLPFGSGNDLWGARCRVQLSSAGRTAVECR